MTNELSTIDLSDLSSVTGGVSVNWTDVAKAGGRGAVVGGSLGVVGGVPGVGVGAAVGGVVGAGREVYRQVVGR